MYILAPNAVAEKYPYSIGELRRDNPQVSFPRNPSESLLADYGVFPVTPTERPDVDPRTERLAEGTPVLIDGQWTQVWDVVALSADEIAARDAEQADQIRAERTRRLSDSDWTQVDDAPLTNTQKAAWAAYRQALRDIPQQAGFPWDVVWPETP